MKGLLNNITTFDKNLVQAFLKPFKKMKMQFIADRLEWSCSYTEQLKRHNSQIRFDFLAIIRAYMRKAR